MKIILLFLGLNFSIAPSHDAAIAMFRIFEVGEETKLFVSMDAIDISEGMHIQLSEMNTESINDFLIRNFSNIFR